MNDSDLRRRLARLEETMPAGVPASIATAAPVARARLLPAAVGLLAVVIVAVIGVSLLSRSNLGSAPVLPSGFYRSEAPIANGICFGIDLFPDQIEAGERPAVWWWNAPADACDQRTSPIYRIQARAEAVQLPAQGDATAVSGYRVTFTADDRDGERASVELTLDPRAVTDDEAAITTFADLRATRPAVVLRLATDLDVPLSSPAP
jgi:hypothetical protein